MNLETLLLKLKGLLEIVRHFRNRGLVLLTRLGCLRLPLLLYRITNQNRHFEMLARPSANSMSDLFVLREVLVEETYRDILPLLPARPLRVLDVGANLGSFTVWLQQRHGLREAFCFEPDPTSFNLCRFNLARNGCDMAQPFAMAIGGQNREILMRVNTGRPGGNSIYASPAGDEETASVKVAALTEWLTQMPGDFDVLKLDCEGAEWEILDHTPAEVFARFSVIVAEIHEDHSHQHQVDDWPARLVQNGFRTIRWDGHAMGLYVGHLRTDA